MLNWVCVGHSADVMQNMANKMIQKAAKVVSRTDKLVVYDVKNSHVHRYLIMWPTSESLNCEHVGHIPQIIEICLKLLKNR